MAVKNDRLTIYHSVAQAFMPGVDEKGQIWPHSKCKYAWDKKRRSRMTALRKTFAPLSYPGDVYFN